MSEIILLATIVTLTALAAMMPAGSSISVANAIQYGNDGMPIGLTGDEFIIVRDTALSDQRVNQLIDGKNYSITDCCGFLRPNETAAWEPVINIRIANETQLGIRVNLDAQKVTAIESGPAASTGSNTNESTGNIQTNTILPIIGIGAAISGTIAFLTSRKIKR